MDGGRSEGFHEAADGNVAGAIGRERGAEKAQRGKDKLKMANEKEEERFLSAQADTFAGANVKGKSVGLLRSK